MVRHTLKILQHLLQDFESVSDHFGTSRIKELKVAASPSLKVHFVKCFNFEMFGKNLVDPKKYCKHLNYAWGSKFCCKLLRQWLRDILTSNKLINKNNRTTWSICLFLIHFRPMFHLRRMWLFHWCFSNILLVKTDYLVST